jgi:hypothetical protein
MNAAEAGVVRWAVLLLGLPHLVCHCRNICKIKYHSFNVYYWGKEMCLQWGGCGKCRYSSEWMARIRFRVVLHIHRTSPNEACEEEWAADWLNNMSVPGDIAEGCFWGQNIGNVTIAVLEPAKAEALVKSESGTTSFLYNSHLWFPGIWCWPPW